MCLQKIFLPQVCIALHCRLGICSNFGWVWQISDGETSRLAQVRDGPYICGAYCFMFSNEDICKDTYQILGGWVGAVTILMWQEKIDWQRRLVRDTIYPGDGEGSKQILEKAPLLMFIRALDRSSGKCWFNCQKIAIVSIIKVLCQHCHCHC